ncbi:hypothetical protein DCAR_0625603 [Daucus carota subsp. sativus]|uniref:Anaphase-promoting complex subunit 4 WD40 domain-containing protein n=1 Tax=Daucus carota subsp. sativus TaxID=79200 RepID=A0AAF0XDR4_DAUCS|nr:hypothetical protein DCAR_0625603 [Daucus carota subsp. sativus]
MESKGKGKRERETAEEKDELKEIQKLQGHAGMRTFEGAHAGTGRFFSWSPEGRFLAIPSYDGTTYIWDKNEDEVHDMEDLDLEEDDKEEVLSVSWDHSGCYLATCSRAAVRIWETLLLPHCESDKLADSEDAIMVQFHPSEDLLFSCCRDDTIEEWYMAQTLDHETKAHSSKGFSISFNATGDKMVTSREDLSIKVWGPEGKLSGDSGREYVSW